jgi:hypothetical protein
MPDLASDSPRREEALLDDLDALLAVRDGHVVFERGHHAHRSSVASVRKSLIGLLYGRSR